MRATLFAVLLPAALLASPVLAAPVDTVVVTATVLVDQDGQPFATEAPAVKMPIVAPEVQKSTTSAKPKSTPALLPAAPGLPRLAIYYQTTHDSSGQPISMLPLITEKGIALTHLIVCTFHVRSDGTIHLNDYPPGDARFATLWEETKILKNSGIRVIGMVGGAAVGSFATNTLSAPDGAVFEAAYKQLHDAIQQFGLQGMDLDVEQSMSIGNIQRLVRRLRSDFGADFTITLAPVGTALTSRGSPNLSGFNYKTLENSDGSSIEWYNAQFYNGFGDMSTTAPFDSVVSNGYSPSKIVIGQITTPANGGQFVEFSKLNTTIRSLRSKYGEIGGVMGWEYFNSQPGGTAEPWEWAQQMTAILRTNDAPTLTVTQADASRLNAAWLQAFAAREEKRDVGSADAADVKPNVDYFAMVNA